MQIQKENQGTQTVYRLTDDELNDMLGEAVVSENESGIRLHGIFVRPELRGRGYGRSLMEAVLSLSEIKTVTLCTGLGNISFFKLFGFEVTEVGESLVTMERQP